MAFQMLSLCFEIMHSKTDTNPKPFVKIARYTTEKAEWMHYTADVPDGAVYFAIRHNSSPSGYQLEMDDFTCQHSYTDSDVKEGYHTYHVTVLYNTYESVRSNAADVTSGLESVATGEITIDHVHGGIRIVNSGASIEESLTTPDGRVILQGEIGTGTSVLPCFPEIYVVKTADKVTKLIVR